jgi:hypothetical protein
VITVWWVAIIMVALLVLGIYGFLMLIRTMTRQLTRKTDRRAEDKYDEFGSARKEGSLAHRRGLINCPALTSAVLGTLGLV